MKVKGVDEQFYPEEISAMIIHKMKQTAAAFLKKPVTKAVITVPALFNDTQRTAIKNAGKIAGLDVLQIMSQSSAVALYSAFLDKGIYLSSFLFYLQPWKTPLEP